MLGLRKVLCRKLNIPPLCLTFVIAVWHFKNENWHIQPLNSPATSYNCINRKHESTFYLLSPCTPIVPSHANERGIFFLTLLSFPHKNNLTEVLRINYFGGRFDHHRTTLMRRKCIKMVFSAFLNWVISIRNCKDAT